MQQLDPGLETIGQFCIAITDELLPARGEVHLASKEIPVIVAVVGPMHRKQEALPGGPRSARFWRSIARRRRLGSCWPGRVHSDFPPCWLLAMLAWGREK